MLRDLGTRRFNINQTRGLTSHAEIMDYKTIRHHFLELISKNIYDTKYNNCFREGVLQQMGF